MRKNVLNITLQYIYLGSYHAEFSVYENIDIFANGRAHYQHKRICIKEEYISN